MGSRYPQSTSGRMAVSLPPGLRSTIDRLSREAGVSREAIIRHLVVLGAPVFQKMIHDGVLPPDPLAVYREKLLSDELAR